MPLQPQSNENNIISTPFTLTENLVHNTHFCDHLQPDVSVFKDIQVEECPMIPKVEDSDAQSPLFCLIEKNLENEILNSSAENSCGADSGEESDNCSIKGIDLSDVGTKIWDRKRLRIFENITTKTELKI